MARRTLAQDESGAFPVFEAVIVAVLILTTVIFFTSLQRPTAATDQGGIDLGQLAADTLVVLQTRRFDLQQEDTTPPIASPPACEALVDDAPLDTWINKTMRPMSATDSCTADVIEEFLREVLPPGTRFQLRLDNGVAPLVLVPFGATEVPRAAYAAEAYVDPKWRMNWVLPAVNATLDNVAPGLEVPAGSPLATARAFLTDATLDCIEAPNGSARAPDGRLWVTHWQAPASPWADPWTDATIPQVPRHVPYGVWTAHTSATIASDGGCSGAAASRLRVGLPDGTRTDWAVYGLQLVVWFGA